MKIAPNYFNSTARAVVLVGALLSLTGCSSMFREPNSKQLREAETAQRTNERSPDLIQRNQTATERTQELAQKNK